MASFWSLCQNRLKITCCLAESGLGSVTRLDLCSARSLDPELRN